MLLSGAAFAEAKVEVTRADLGFGDRYKVGSWTPLRLEISGGEKTITAVAYVRVPDGEGTSTGISSAPFSVTAHGQTTVEMLVRVGRLDAPIDVRIVNVETGKTVSKRRFLTARELDKGGVAPGEPATTRMVVEVGPTHLGTASIGAQKSSQKWYTQNLVGRVVDPSLLPTSPLAYEGVDTVLISTSDRDAWTGMRPDDARVQALVDWVNDGGRVILFCGANADLLLGSDGPLAALAPGIYTGSVTVDNFEQLEKYTPGNAPLPARRMRTSVPFLDQLHGDVDLWQGSGEDRLPLIVRAREGLGQVVFVGLDIDTPPLQRWEGRNRLVEKLLDFDDETRTTESSDYYYDGPTDLSLSLTQRLDKELENSGIRTPPFWVIACLVLLYILLIGPGDYWLVKRIFKRMEWTWVTFPAIVVLTCAAAYWYANYLKGDSLRINRLEVVDIDNATGEARGTLWTHIFSPNPTRYHLTLDAKTPIGEAADDDSAVVAWLGRPTTGMGGMSTDASRLLGPPSYRWSPDRKILSGAPVEVWSTKSFVTRWKMHTDALLVSELTRTTNGLVVGDIENPTSLDLSNCKLVYGSWAWAIGDLPSGGNTTIETSSISNTSAGPKKLRNLFRSEHDLDLSQGSYREKQILIGRLQLRAIAELMMFYDALGGRTQCEQWHRHQHFVDLSHALGSDTAMLVGECDAPRSELLRLESPGDPASGQSMRGPQDVNVVLYRYLLHVAKPPDSDAT